MDTYTHGHNESVLRSHSWRTVENSAAYLLPFLEEGLSLLDVGAGPGTISVDFARRLGPEGQVTAIDQAAKVIEKAKQNTPENIDTVTFAVGDIYAIDFADDSFDIVHAHQVLQHLSDPVAALREMHRVCKPGGIVAARDADYQGMTWAPQNNGLDLWMDIYQRVARSNKAEPNAGRHLLGWAQQVEFRQIEASADVWCFTTEEERTWWGTLWADRILDSSLASQALERKIATEEDLQYIAQSFHQWIKDPGAWFTCPHGQFIAHK